MNVKVQLLSVLLAALVWLSVMMERPGQAVFPVPVQPVNVPTGLSVAVAAPSVEVTVAGPRVLLLLLPYRGIVCNVDLRGASAGSWSYAPREADIVLPERDLKLERVFPQTIPVTVMPVGPRR